MHSSSILGDFPLGIIISSPTVITKVTNGFDFNTETLLGINNNALVDDTAVLTQLTPPHSPPRSLTTNNSAAASPAAYQQAVQKVDNKVRVQCIEVYKETIF